MLQLGPGQRRSGGQAEHPHRHPLQLPGQEADLWSVWGTLCVSLCQSVGVCVYGTCVTLLVSVCVGV